MITYGWVVLGSWGAFILVWSVLAFNVKRDIRGGGVGSVWYRYFLLRFVLLLLLVFVAVRLATGQAHYAKLDSALFSRMLFVPSPALGWVGAALAVLGVAFAIWARLHLGRDWSPAPAVKEGHELVTSGPYRLVRHPIYTGVILAAFGASLTGTTFGVVVFLIVTIMFVLRIGREEKIMLELFPDAYPAYQARTKRLVPFVW